MKAQQPGASAQSAPAQAGGNLDGRGQSAPVRVIREGYAAVQEGFGFEGSGQDGAFRATRPALPPVFFVAAGLWAGIGAAYLFLEAASLPVT
ncbi:MAG: hypothetical protein RSB68_03105, partial [Raoultibacter sp.]